MKDKHRKQMKIKQRDGKSALVWVNDVYRPWFTSGAYKHWYAANKEAADKLDDAVHVDTPREAVYFVEKIYRPWYEKYVGAVQTADDSGGNPGTPPPPPPGTPIKP